MSPRPLVLTSSNMKGGCAKTSTLFHLSGVFANRGQQVLLIDADPQGSLSQSMFSSQAIEEWNEAASLTGLFDDRLGSTPEQVIHATRFPHISIVPATSGLKRFNHADPMAWGWLQDTIRQLLAEVGSQYDIVLIDTPPNLQLLTWSAMVAANTVVTPVIPEDYASQGLLHVKRFIEEVTHARNPHLRWGGLLLTMVQMRLGIHIAYQQVIRQAYGDLVLNTVIPQVAAFKEAVAAKTPLPIYKPRVAGSKAIIALADELLVRFNSGILPEAA